MVQVISTKLRPGRGRGSRARLADERVPTRRTEGVRTRGRSARVVGAVLRATAEELGRAGYAALRVEDVAARSRVNKTTIYRRWPTKVDLVTAAIRHFADSPPPPDTGSVRDDLILLLKHTAKKTQTPLGRGIVRTIQLERAHPDVDLVTRQMAAEHLRIRCLVVERGVLRGELPPGTDADLVVELTFAPVIRRVIAAHRPVDDAFIEAAVDVVLSGARSGAAVRRGGARSPAGKLISLSAGRKASV
jgi:AcrR family transcriptional regulator